MYRALLEISPETGYGVAKAISKPAANVYKALETLEGKGAVVVDEGDRKHYRAVPAREFLGRLEQEFSQNRDHATEALSRLGGPKADDRIYQLRTREQVLHRCREMLKQAQEQVLLDLFPLPARELRDDLVAVAERGVQVVAKVYDSEIEVPGAKLVMEPEHETTRARWPGQWVCLYVDGSETLIAFFEPDGSEVIQAIWTESPQLGWIFVSMFSHEIGYTQLKNAFEQGTDDERLGRVFEETRSYFRLNLRGYQRLLESLGRTGADGLEVSEEE